MHPAGIRAAIAAWDKRRSGGEALASATTTCIETVGAWQKIRWHAFIEIVVADVSMSLDNMLAFAGAAKECPVALDVGLAPSIGPKGTAAMIIARLLEKHPWIACEDLRKLVDLRPSP